MGKISLFHSESRRKESAGSNPRKESAGSNPDQTSQKNWDDAAASNVEVYAVYSRSNLVKVALSVWLGDGVAVELEQVVELL